MIGNLIIAIALCLVVTAQGFAVSKMDAFRQFRPTDPVRESIEFVGNSITSIFAPLNPTFASEKLNTHIPLVKTPQSIYKLRQQHRKNRWAGEDMAAAFEQHFVYRAPKLLQNAMEELLPVNYDSDATNFVAYGAIQAFSPIQYNTVIQNKALPPFQKQVKLSELKDKMKHGQSYFN
mmetsp:Transcript_28994/g.39827  ORF Transcript_28994/g.39827 Transcript_28994/m.39827 type:complete len:177 (-) Transcript_28994:191-721(-)|eukprot:CAMPEP_0170101036 /NCGR_PEP_ID=MMETSP0020_2-20130122/2018_1 /TAXON_ID=98059 /ORGANISM="Dinobryon sp., Strain UTEXLB2267" /LENGTH=176 /DNA_ID=CAMNT_0010324053 /DNA_START=110 /DNA_END=640 /DNA_ORIENTATION=-